jgi:hypothetical protein
MPVWLIDSLDQDSAQIEEDGARVMTITLDPDATRESGEK